MLVGIVLIVLLARCARLVSMLQLLSLSCVYSCKEGDVLLRRQTVSALAQDYRYPKDIYLIGLNAYYVKINLEPKWMRYEFNTAEHILANVLALCFEHLCVALLSSTVKC